MYLERPPLLEVSCWLDGYTLSVGSLDSEDLEGPSCMGIHLAELPVASGHQLAWLEVEEHGRMDLVLFRLPCGLAYPLLQLGHPLSSHCGKHLNPIGYSLIIGFFLFWGGLVWEGW